MFTRQLCNPVSWVDGTAVKLDAPPAVFGGRTLVPVRFVAESFGGNVTWDRISRTVAIRTRQDIPATGLHPSPVTAPVPPIPARARLTPQEVAELVRPALLLIESHRGFGSGFFVSPEGLALTNAHVARGSRELSATTLNGERFRAAILKIDNFTDLALLRIEIPLARSFPFIGRRAYSKDVPVGGEVLAFGNPRGLVWTVTRVIVSAKREMSPSQGAWVSNTLIIQHDAAIAPGSSGGPLVNLYGDWIGVNTMMLRELQGFNFAVPADQYHHLTQQGIYSLRDDWSSYFAESFHWLGELAGVIRTYNEAAQSLPGKRAALFGRALSDLLDLRARAGTYQPLFREIERLHALLLQDLDAFSALIAYYLDVETGRRHWSRTTADWLFSNAAQAQSIHRAERDRISALFR